MSRISSTIGVRRWVAAGAAIMVTFAACGGADDSSIEGDSSNADAEEPASEPTEDGAGGGTLVLGDETIKFDGAQCFLQEQDAAAGGGKILFVAQGSGINAAGEEVLLDVSRYDEDSQFVGDDVSVDIGDPFSGAAVSWTGGGDIGTVTVDGSTVSAGGLTFENFDEGTEQPGSFEINC